MKYSHNTLKVLCDRANLTGHFSEYIGHLSPLVGAADRRMRDGYGNVCHELWIGIRRWTRINERADLLAVYHFGQVMNHSRGGRTAVVIPSKASDLGHGKMEQAVFVKVVEFPEHPEKRRKSWVRAVVRLEPFDYAEFMRCQLAMFTDKVLEGAELATDREGPLSRTWGRIHLSTEDSDSVDSVVQGTPEAVQGIAGYQRPPLQGRRLDGSESGPEYGEISVVFWGKTIRLDVDPGRDFLLDGTDMVLGSTDFCPYAREVNAHATDLAESTLATP